MASVGNFQGNPYQIQPHGFAPTTTVFSGYQNLMNTDHVVSVSDPMVSAPGPPSVKSSKTGVIPKPSQSSQSPTIVVNACLAFIKSEMSRRDNQSVIEAVSRHFTLEDIKSALEALFGGAGVGRYSYRPPNDPCTSYEKSSHCVKSIIAKFNELKYELNMPRIKFVQQRNCLT